MAYTDDAEIYMIEETALSYTSGAQGIGYISCPVALWRSPDPHNSPQSNGYTVHIATPSGITYRTQLQWREMCRQDVALTPERYVKLRSENRLHPKAPGRIRGTQSTRDRWSRVQRLAFQRYGTEHVRMDMSSRYRIYINNYPLTLSEAEQFLKRR